MDNLLFRFVVELADVSVLPIPVASSRILCALCSPTSRRVVELEIDRSRLFLVHPAHSARVSRGNVCTQVDLRSKSCHDLLVSALVLFAQEMLSLEVIAHLSDRGVEEVDSISVAEMAEVMFLAQVSEQLVLVQIPEFTVVAERMTFVGFVVGIADSLVRCQLASGVAATLLSEDLQIVRADLAVMQLMHLPDMLLKLLEVEERLVIALWAAVLEQSHEGAANLLVGERDPEVLVVQPCAELTVQGCERRDRLRENDLEKQLLS